MTLDVVILRIPRATPHVHSQIATVPTIAQFAHPWTCHSHAGLPLYGCAGDPMRSRRKIRVRKGIDARTVIKRMVGERASRKGLAMRSSVVSASVAEVVWT